MIATINLYLAFVEDLDTVVYFLLFQDTSALPRNIQYLMIDFHVVGHLAQSASQ